jgi:hypothetical protein
MTILLLVFFYIFLIFENIIVNQMTNVCISSKLYKSSKVLRYVAIGEKLMATGNL